MRREFNQSDYGDQESGASDTATLWHFSIWAGRASAPVACGISLMKVTSGIPAILSHSSTADLRAPLEELLTPVGLSLAALMLVSPPHIVSYCLSFLGFSHLVSLGRNSALAPCPLDLCLLLLLGRYYYIFNDSCCFARRSGPSANPNVLLYASKMRWSPFGFDSALWPLPEQWMRE